MPFPLEGKTLVMTGTFDFTTADDAHWALVAKGAKVATAVTKTTSAVVAGADPLPRVMEGAKKHGTPVLGPEGLKALLAGATLAAARTAETAARQAPGAGQPLAGKTVLLCTKLPRGSAAGLRATLERLGARVVGALSGQVDLAVMGDAPGFDAIDALAAGVPALSPADVAALEAGEKLRSFTGLRDLVVPDAAAWAADQLARLEPALVAIDLGGETWHDTLSVTLHPGGRVAVRLAELGGTPTEAHMQRILQRADWPAVAAPVEVKRSLTIPGLAD